LNSERIIVIVLSFHGVLNAANNLTLRFEERFISIIYRTQTSVDLAGGILTKIASKK